MIGHAEFDIHRLFNIDENSQKKQLAHVICIALGKENPVIATHTFEPSVAYI